MYINLKNQMLGELINNLIMKILFDFIVLQLQISLLKGNLQLAT